MATSVRSVRFSCFGVLYWGHIEGEGIAGPLSMIVGKESEKQPGIGGTAMRVISHQLDKADVILSVQKRLINDFDSIITPLMIRSHGL